LFGGHAKKKPLKQSFVAFLSFTNVFQQKEKTKKKKEERKGEN